MAESWENKTVVVAGGSSGLGLAIARAFHQTGATIVLLARTESKLAIATEQLNRLRAASSFHYCIDLTDNSEVNQVVGDIIALRGKIDVWVNAVGQSTRAHFAKTTIASYRELMEQNFFAVVNTTYAVLSHLENSSGYLINIGSLASKTAWPYVSPYVTSKHALAGFTNQTRLEGPQNIHVLFVCPGPIASSVTDQKRYAIDKEMNERAARPGAGAPVSAIDPEWLAKKIIRACEKRKPELVIPGKSRLLFGLLQLWPSIGNFLLRRFAAKK